MAQTTPFSMQVPIARAEGLYLYGPDERRYMDLVSGIGVNHVGHSHPHVVEAIIGQVKRHLHVMAYGEYIQSAPNALVAKLAKLLPATLDCAYLTNSGTEANEGALKLAKRYTGRTELISCHKSYHGSTHGSLSVSGNEVKKRAFRPLLPDVRFITFNDPADLAMITERTAAVIMETVQGDAGVRIPSKDYMQALRRRCDETGTLLILDEIQCGMGRTGTFWAFEHFGIVPDILTLAKALGGGLPLGAFIARYEMMKTLTHDPMMGHLTTFGGNPAACAAAVATLEVMENEKLPQQAEDKGKLFVQLLKHPRIKGIRQIGLMMAVDLDSAEEVTTVLDDALANGAIFFRFLSNPDSFRISPPLIITEDQIKEACNILLKALDKI